MYYSDPVPGVARASPGLRSSGPTVVGRSKVRIRSVAPPLGRRCIQFGSGESLQSRLALRVSVCDWYRHIGAVRVIRCSRVAPGQGGLDELLALEIRAWPPHPTPLRSGGTAKQGNRQAYKAVNRSL